MASSIRSCGPTRRQRWVNRLPITRSCRPLGLLLLALHVVGALSLSPRTLSAQGPSVTDEGVENRFPDDIEFRVSARSDQPIEKIRLHYTVLPDGTTASGVPEFEPGTSVSTSRPVRGSRMWW